MSKKEEILHKLTTKDRNYIKEKFREKDQKITELEAKLAESETDNKALICDYESRITKHQELMSWLEHDNEQLKHQLAESEKKYEDRKQFCINEIDSQMDLINNLLKENTELQQKLNEKEKEISVLISQLCLSQISQSIDQDKISFAVEQIEQLRHDIWTNQADDGYTDMQVDLYTLNDMIDVRIIQIKEGK